MTLRGWTMGQQGQANDGMKEMQNGLAASEATGAVMIRSYYLALLAEVQAKGGCPQEGLETIQEALELARTREVQHYEAEMYRLKGELTLQQILVQSSRFQVEEEAEACFHKALDIARQQSAKLFELRAATGLARVWQQHGKTTEARNLLAPVYEWFTEGFDTQDLQEAKALLGELSAESNLSH